MRYKRLQEQARQSHSFFDFKEKELFDILKRIERIRNYKIAAAADPNAHHAFASEMKSEEFTAAGIEKRV